MNQVVRVSKRSVENTFHQDDARLRVLNAAETFAVLRHFALTILKRHPAKLSLQRKRFKAALDDTFRSQLFAHF